MQWGQLMKREKSYRIKSKDKIYFKDCNQTITELCWTFNNLSSIISNSALKDQLEHSSDHPYSSGLWHSLYAYFKKPSKENCSCRMNSVLNKHQRSPIYCLGSLGMSQESWKWSPTIKLEDPWFFLFSWVADWLWRDAALALHPGVIFLFSFTTTPLNYNCKYKTTTNLGWPTQSTCI